MPCLMEYVRHQMPKLPSRQCELCGVTFDVSKDDVSKDDAEAKDVTKCKSCRNQLELISYDQIEGQKNSAEGKRG